MGKLEAIASTLQDEGCLCCVDPTEEESRIISPDSHFYQEELLLARDRVMYGPNATFGYWLMAAAYSNLGYIASAIKSYQVFVTGARTDRRLTRYIPAAERTIAELERAIAIGDEDPLLIIGRSVIQ